MNTNRLGRVDDGGEIRNPAGAGEGKSMRAGVVTSENLYVLCSGED